MEKNIRPPVTIKESLYKSFFHAVPNGLVIFERSTGIVVEANQAAATMHGYTLEEFVGLPVTEFIHSVSHHLQAQLAETLETQDLFEAQAIHVRQDGSSFHVEWRGVTLMQDDQHYILLSFQDNTKRIEEAKAASKLGEDQIREQSKLLEISEAFAAALDVKQSFILEQFRAVIEFTHAVLFSVEESVLLVTTTHDLNGLEQARPLTIQLDLPENITSIFHRHRPIRIADINSADRNAEFLRSFMKEESAVMLDGMKSWMWVPLAVRERIVAVIGLAHSEPDHFTPRHADMAMTVANHAAITMINAELIENAQSLAILQERQRLARNLHDAVNQSLFSAGLIAEVLPRLWEEDQRQARRSLQDLRKLTRGAIAEMRMLVAELRPLALTESNFSDLLQQLADAFTGRTNIPVSVTISGDDVFIDPVQVAFYRICQEALNNIAKHAKASRVRIQLQYSPKRVEMRVRDNGNGFDTNLPALGHYGLDMMYERAKAAGAHLEIKSQPGKGTDILLTWQVTKEKENT